MTNATRSAATRATTKSKTETQGKPASGKTVRRKPPRRNREWKAEDERLAANVTEARRGSFGGEYAAECALITHRGLWLGEGELCLPEFVDAYDAD